MGNPPGCLAGDRNKGAAPGRRRSLCGMGPTSHHNRAPSLERPSVHLAVCNAASSPVSFPGVPGACTLTEALAHPSQKGRLVVRQPGAMQAGQHPVRCVSPGYGQRRSSTEVGSGGMCDTGHTVSAGWSQSCDKGLHFPWLPPTQCPAGLWPTSPRSGDMLSCQLQGAETPPKRTEELQTFTRT